MEKALEQFPEQMQTALAEAMPEAEDVVFLAMTDEPASPTYPLNWDSAKQRRAFFATNGFGGGIPYERRGALQAIIEESPVSVAPGLISGKVFAIEEWAKYVIGEVGKQSNIHMGRWQTVTETATDVRERVVGVFSGAVARAIQQLSSNIGRGG